MSRFSVKDSCLGLENWFANAHASLLVHAAPATMVVPASVPAPLCIAGARADVKRGNKTIMGTHARLFRRVPSAVLPAALLMASLISMHSHVGDAAVGGLSSAELLQTTGSASVRFPAVHRLRGGELGGGTRVSSQGSPALSSTLRSPMYSSEMRASELRGRQSVHFESSKDHTHSQQSPLPEHLKALKQQLEQQKLKEFVSPTNLRTADGAHDLDLSTPMAANGEAAINRAFASLATAAGTPYKTPVKGWPARFRHELELLKSAMETYSSSQKEAMQALVREKQRASSLEQQKAKLEEAMQHKLAEMEKVKTVMEERALQTEDRLKTLREQMASQELHDTEVSKQLANLEAAKSALQARAARAAEEADTLREQLSSATTKCSSLSSANAKLHERVEEMPPLKEHLKRVEAAKDESQRELSHMAEQHRLVLREAQMTAKEISELKDTLASRSAAQTRMEKEVKMLSKEKNSIIEQLRAADRSGRQVCVCVLVWALEFSWENLT